jgi:hypothetical protein
VIQTRSIEVVDWEENVDDIMKVIKKKCKRAYPDHYFLLVNARHGKGYLDFDRVIEEMKAITSPFLEVWVVVMVATGYMKVVRIAPGGLSIDLDLGAELPNAMKQEPFVKRGIRGTGTEIRDLGHTYMPIPRGD